MRIRFAIFSFIVLLAQFSASQLIVEASRYPTSGPVEFNLVDSATDPSGNVYLLGSGGVPIAQDPTGGPWGYDLHPGGFCYLAKLDSAGVVQWWKSFGSSKKFIGPRKLALAQNGDVIIAGYVDTLVYPYIAMWIKSLSPSGQVLSEFSDLERSEPRTLLPQTDGTLIVESHAQLGVYFESESITKYSLNTGAIQWHIEPGQLSGNLTQELYGNGTGTLYHYGMSGGVIDIDKINSQSGQVTWHQVFGFAASYVFQDQSVGILPAGDFYLAGVMSRTALPPKPDLNRVRAVVTVSQADGSQSWFPVGSTEIYVYASLLGSPAIDSQGNFYWAAHQTNADGTGVKSMLEKSDPAGNIVFSSPLSATYTNALVTPTPSGGLLAAVSDGKNPRAFRQLSSVGALQWSAKSDPAQLGTGGWLNLDSTGNPIYVNQGIDVLNEHWAGAIKLSSVTGKSLYDNLTRPSGIVNATFNRIGRDPSGNSYVYGSDNFTPFVAKLSPVGSLVWKQPIAPASAFFGGSKVISTDYSPTYGVAVSVMGTSGPAAAVITTSGVVKWAGSYTSARPGVLAAQCVKFDPSGDVIVSHQNTASAAFVEIDKLSGATGQTIWSKVINGAISYGPIGVDASGSIYDVGKSVSHGVVIYKLKADSTLVFTRFRPTPPDNGLNWGKESQASFEFDSQTGDFFLMTSLYAIARPDSAYRIGRYSGSGNVLWEKLITLDIYPGYGSSLRYVPGTASLFLTSNGPDGSVSANASRVFRIDASNGNQLWVNLSTERYLASTDTYIDFDPYGNVVASPRSCGGSIRKIDLATGATRWSIHIGGFSPQVTRIEGLTVGPDDQPLVYGETTAELSIGTQSPFSLKYAFLPHAIADSYSTKKNVALDANVRTVLDNDEDPVGATCEAVTSPTHAAAFSLGSDGTLTYTPKANFVGTDGFTYRIMNTAGKSNIAKVVIIVTR